MRLGTIRLSITISIIVAQKTVMVTNLKKSKTATSIRSVRKTATTILIAATRVTATTTSMVLAVAAM